MLLHLPGEFTLRAFLNGRLDLSQAEDVGKLISAKSVAAADAALAGIQVLLVSDLERYNLQSTVVYYMFQLRGCLLTTISNPDLCAHDGRALTSSP